MSLMDLIREDATRPRKRRRPPRCIVGRIQFDMDSEDAAALQRTISDERQFTAANISRGMAEAGKPVSESSVKRHRKQECSCFTDA